MGSIRKGRLRPLGLFWTAARGRWSPILRERAGRVGHRELGGRRGCDRACWHRSVADRFERGGAEGAESVEAAAGELARDRERGLRVREAARLEREVVLVVGAGGSAGGLGGLVECPACVWWSLAGELAEPGAAVGAVEADAEVALQRPAAGLVAGEPVQLALERGELGVDRVDERERDLDPLARGLGQ